MTWTVIAGTRYDAESIADADLFADMVGNTEHVFDGTQVSADLVNQTSVAAGAIGQGELKTSTETVGASITFGAGGNITFSAMAGYGFLPQTTVAAGSASMQFYWGGYNIASGTAYGYRYGVYNSGAGTATATGSAIYVTATRPHYLLGRRQDWGLWAYAVLDAQGNLVRTYLSEDPPAYIQASSRLLDAYGRPCVKLCRLAKKDPLLHTKRPHPFLEAQADGELPDGHRVVLLDLRALEVDAPSRWRPDVEELQRQQAMALSMPDGDTRSALDAHVAELQQAVAKRDAEIADAEAAMAKAPATVDELAQVYADVEVRALRRRRSQLVREIESISSVLVRSEITNAQAAELLVARQQAQDTLQHLEAVRIPEAQRELPQRIERARVRAADALPVIQRRLRAAAGIVTKSEVLMRSAGDYPGSAMDSIFGGGGSRYQAFDLEAGATVERTTPTKSMHPLVDAALGGVSADDKSHPDHDGAKMIPGLFVPKTNEAGDRPAVTILSPR